MDGYRQPLAKNGKPRSRHQRTFWTLAVACVIAILGSLGTYAAFTATTTNAGNQIESGTVAISDNDAGGALYQLTDQKPADTVDRCIKVTYTGSLDSVVSLYASSVGALGNDIDLTITPGTQSGGFPTCTGFAADSGGAIWTGTLKGFADSHTDFRSGLADNPGTSQRWQTNNTVAYKLTLTMRDSAAPNTHTNVLTTGAHAFTWEARNHDYAQQVMDTSGLVSYWRLGEEQGTTAKDAKGTNNGSYNSGSNLGSTGAMAGDPDKSALFDGVSGRAFIGNPASLQTANGTIEGWFKTTSSAGAGVTVWAKPNASLVQVKAGQLRVQDYGSATERSTGVSVNDGAWHHFALTFQSGVAGGTSVYLDGVDVLDTTTAISDQTGVAQIGSRGGWPFPGNIDDVAAYNRPLTASEIKAHFNAAK